MNILFIGDIVGKPGRKIVKKFLPKLKEEYNIDYVIANYENIAHGFGVTEKTYNELKNAGVDIFTGGNHTFDRKKEAIPLLEAKKILRPLNYFEAPGDWYYEDDNIIVISAMGIFSMPYGKNPFIELKNFVENKEKFIFIDFHAEATAEKKALFHLLKGKVGAIVGTHTHIGTDDLEIEDGTCYLTDIGITGCKDNVIGMKIDGPIDSMLTGIKQHFDVPDKCKSIMQCLIINADGLKSKKAFKLKIIDDKILKTQEV
ncbi:YmdB family metallophosphoesterase [Caminibacter mediatlanticus TB-2]|uniref:YmdB family metallophosphoesterase n=1 Tax=Caminibacter mediatlanticus TB-2 TaxID=391592 RepID=A0ABX5V8A3_9BACT|nr:TIGR00282 family metallophosphoesterase [Caminibacter mediatlanticus]QCT94456.1 YmdB family metallophosphoesterase [Caminibacter mediatlanticus TB-2]